MTVMNTQEPFYGKFIKAPHAPLPQENRGTHQKKTRPQRNCGTAAHAVSQPYNMRGAQRSEEDRQKPPRGFSHYEACAFGQPVFSALNPEAKKILEHFPALLDGILPLDAKKKRLLPQHIRELFHELTDERGRRKTQYLNDPVKLSAYMHYYVRWNLVRLTKLLQNMDIPLQNGEYAADFGSGPLTFVCALWIAKPELRKRQLTWYCIDISNKALAFGEELFLALCAYTGRETSEHILPWQIKKICGSFGTPLKEKVSLVTEANMFNEVFWNSSLSLDAQAEKTFHVMEHYIMPKGSVLLIEPGIPLAGEFLSLLRMHFLQSGFLIHAPCPHSGSCCFPNRRQSNAAVKMPIAYNKWCHFTFETDDSPKNLLRLSEAAKLGKERASLSFLFCSAGSERTSPPALSANPARCANGKKTPPCTTEQQHEIAVRICSDIIVPEPQTIGRYACSEKGFMLITSPAYKDSVLNKAVSGSLLILSKDSVLPHRRDKKTNALLVQLT